MELPFICTGTNHMNPKRWEGCIRLLKTSAPYELEVTARHTSFHILCGKHEYGN